MRTPKNSWVFLTGIIFFAITFCIFNTYVNAETMAPAQAPAKTTLDNLMAAYNGESNAHARYLAFAQKADAEGYGRVASLFRAAAQAEQIHFEHHAKVIVRLGGTPAARIEASVVKSTKENLEEALKGETYEKNTMYPGFLAQAEKEGIKDAAESFEDAGAAEAVHASLYQKALKELETWKAKKEFYVCPVCGNVEASPVMKCSICMVSGEKFITIS